MAPHKFLLLLLLSILLLIPFSLSLSRKGNIAKRQVDYAYETGSDSDGDADISFDDLGLLPGKVDALRNITTALTENLDDGHGTSDQVNDPFNGEGFIIIDYNEDDVDDTDDPVKDPDNDESVLHLDTAKKSRRRRDLGYDDSYYYYYNYDYDYNGDDVDNNSADEPVKVPDYIPEDDDYDDESVLHSDTTEKSRPLRDFGYDDSYDYRYNYDYEFPDSEEEKEQEEEEEEKVEFKGCGRKRVRTTEGLMRILGGGEAQKGSWPWQVAILDIDKDLLCGGTLIAPQWILTAAHCLDKNLYVRLGEQDFRITDKHEIDVKVVKTFSYPYYDQETFAHDIALLKLKQNVIYTRYIIPACLPGLYTPLPMYSKCYISGWGKKKETDAYGSKVLHYVRIPIVSMATCKRSYPSHPISNDQFCAGFRTGISDTCSGDSGGPLVCDDQGYWTIHGVTSFGFDCGEADKYGVYTKVKKYLKWMKKIMKYN